MLSLLDFIKEYALSIGLIIIGIIVVISLIRAIIDFTYYMLPFFHRKKTDNENNDLYAETECNGIVHYYAYIRKESDPEEEKQLLKAQLNSITHITEKLIDKKKYQTVISTTTYELQKIQLPDGSDIHFITTNETTKQHHAPELTMNHETLVTSADGEKFYITLTPDAVILHRELTTAECDGIFYHPAKVRNVDSTSDYNEDVEIKSITTITERFTPLDKFEVVSEKTTYYLQRICWRRGGRSSFIREIAPGEFTSPLLLFDTEMTFTSNDGKTYSITVSKNRIEIPEFINKQIKAEQDKINRLKKNIAYEIEKLAKNSKEQHKIAAGIIADYNKHLRLRIAEELETKNHPAPKAAEEVRKLTKELNAIEKKYLSLKYQYEKTFTHMVQDEEKNNSSS